MFPSTSCVSLILGCVEEAKSSLPCLVNRRDVEFSCVRAEIGSTFPDPVVP